MNMQSQTIAEIEQDQLYDFLTDFQRIVSAHSLRPAVMLYNSNALAGEAGEVANVVKKIEMATQNPEWINANKDGLPTIEEFKQQLTTELSDVLFYLVRLAADNGVSLFDLINVQSLKLSSQSEKYGRVFLK